MFQLKMSRGFVSFPTFIQMILTEIRFVLPEFWHFEDLKPSNVWRELLFTYLSFTTLILRVHIAFVIVFSRCFPPPSLLHWNWVELILYPASARPSSKPLIRWLLAWKTNRKEERKTIFWLYFLTLFVLVECMVILL